MTNPAYEATNSDVEKLTRTLVASAMLSSIEDYLFEILDSVENDIGKLTASDSYTLNAWVRSAIEKAAEELESQPLCVKSNDAMREVAPLCVKSPEDFPDDVELLIEIEFLDDVSVDIKTAQWLKELRRRRAGTVEGE